MLQVQKYLIPEAFIADDGYLLVAPKATIDIHAEPCWLHAEPWQSCSCYIFFGCLVHPLQTFRAFTIHIQPLVRMNPTVSVNCCTYFGSYHENSLTQAWYLFQPINRHCCHKHSDIRLLVIPSCPLCISILDWTGIWHDEFKLFIYWKHTKEREENVLKWIQERMLKRTNVRISKCTIFRFRIILLEPTTRTYSIFSIC